MNSSLHPEIVGAYPVSGHDGVFVVEMWIRRGGKGKAGKFPSCCQGDRESHSEAVFLTPDGINMTGGLIGSGRDSPLWDFDIRVAFYLEGLDPSLPLETPWGVVDLPSPTPVPDRLKLYEEWYEPSGH